MQDVTTVLPVIGVEKHISRCLYLVQLSVFEKGLEAFLGGLAIAFLAWCLAEHTLQSDVRCVASQLVCMWNHE